MGKPSLHEVLNLSYSNRDKQKEGLKKYIIQFYGNDPKQSPDFPRIINAIHFCR